MKYNPPAIVNLSRGLTNTDCNTGSGASGGGNAIVCDSGINVESLFVESACFGGIGPSLDATCAYGKGDSGNVSRACGVGSDALEITNGQGSCEGGSGVT